MTVNNQSKCESAAAPGEWNHRQTVELKFLGDRSQWPHFADAPDWKYVCFRRPLPNPAKGTDYERGFIAGHSWEMNLGCVFDGGTGQTIQYDSAEDILRDGWYVD